MEKLKREQFVKYINDLCKEIECKGSIYDNPFSYYYGDADIEFWCGRFDRKGCVTTITGETIEEIKECVNRNYESFDIEEEVYIYLEFAKSRSDRGGVPEISELLYDLKCEEEILEKIKDFTCNYDFTPIKNMKDKIDNLTIDEYKKLFLEVIEFEDFELFWDEKGFGLIDTQKANLGDIESERFYTLPAVLERMEIYHRDYLYDGWSFEDASKEIQEESLLANFVRFYDTYKLNDIVNKTNLLEEIYRPNVDYTEEEEVEF